MYIVNFDCVLLFTTGILKNFDFLKIFDFFENFFENLKFL